MSDKVYFFDTSALVKVYVLEPGTDRVRALVRSAVKRPGEVVVAVCDLAEAEATSAVVRKHGDGEITRAQCERYIVAIARDFTPPSPYFVIDAGSVMPDAPGLIRTHGLRTLDAVQLAAALAVFRLAPPDVDFVLVASDGPLCEAAEAEGMRVMSPG